MSRGIVRWSAHLGGSVGASETVTVIVGGSDITEYVIETNRIERLCMTGATWLVALDLDCPTTVYPWDPIVLYEDGTKVLTGYIASVSTEFSKKPRITIEGVDTWKRALDYWTIEEYYTSGDTMLGLVAYYLDMCG